MKRMKKILAGTMAMFLSLTTLLDAPAEGADASIVENAFRVTDGIESFQIGQLYDLNCSEEWPLRADYPGIYMTYTTIYRNRIYERSGLRIMTTNVNHAGEGFHSDRKHRIYFLELTAGDYRTERGIGVGSTVSEVQKTYADMLLEEGTVMVPNSDEPFDRTPCTALIYRQITQCPLPYPYRDNTHQQILAFLYDNQQRITKILLAETDPESSGYKKTGFYSFERTLTYNDLTVTDGKRSYQIGKELLNTTEPYFRNTLYCHRGGMDVEGLFDQHYTLKGISKLISSNFNHFNLGDSDKKYRISNISLKTDEFHTMAGIKVGDTIEKVKNAYRDFKLFDTEMFIDNEDGVTMSPYPALECNVTFPCEPMGGWKSELWDNTRTILLIIAFDDEQRVITIDMDDHHNEKIPEYNPTLRVVPRS